jgi:hypothetical protein
MNFNSAVILYIASHNFINERCTSTFLITVYGCVVLKLDTKAHITLVFEDPLDLYHVHGCQTLSAQFNIG